MSSREAFEKWYSCDGLNPALVDLAEDHLGYASPHCDEYWMVWSRAWNAASHNTGLTEQDRRALKTAAILLDNSGCDETARALRSILERT